MHEVLTELSHRIDVRQAVSVTRVKGSYRPGALRQEERAEVHASHRAQTTAVAEAQQGMLGFINPEPATIQRSVREREETMQFQRDVES